MKTINEEAKYFSMRESVQFGFISGINFAQRWIPIKEELPEYNQSILIKTDSNYVDVAFMDNINGEVEFINKGNILQYNVTHWRPIEYK